MAKKPNWQNRIISSGEEDADQLLANPFNARIHPQFQQQALEGVLDTIGWVQRVIVNQRTGHVVDGHLRVALAITRGEQVPVDYVDLTEDEEKAILASFDYITSLAVYDKDQLDTLLKQVNSDDARVQELLSKLAEDVGLYKEPSAAPDAQIDRAAELAKQYGTAIGQAWQLGRHRLIIGDCTDKVTRASIIQGNKVQIVITDPPYNIDYEYVSYDDNLSKEDYADIARQWFTSMCAISEKVIVTPGRQNIELWAGFDKCHIGAWIKENAHGGASIAHFAKWEPIFFYGKHKRERDCDVFTFHVDNGFLNDASAVGHSCPKPISLWNDLIQNYSDRDDIVFDLFLGSGTTLIACEQSSRICLGTEISPEYAAVTIQRWEAATGQQAMQLEPRLVE